MKTKFTYPLLLLLAVAAGCIKKPKIINVGEPLGTFNGQLTQVHLGATKYDTSRASLQLVLSINIGFTIQGDTTFQAGSFGSFSYTNDQFTFVDHTYPGLPQKTHLNGTYDYSWDGTNLEIVGASSDTLFYDYKFKRTSTQQ